MSLFKASQSNRLHVACGSIIFLMGGAAPVFPTEPENVDATTVAGFLGKYCIDCHNVDALEGEREFESFQLPITTAEQLVTADEIVDQVTLKLMPPKDADTPSDRERLGVVEQLRQRIRDARGNLRVSRGRTVMRRLSNREYESTLAALFDRRVDTLGLTADFPKDKTSQHMDTIGDSLVTSGFLLDQYFQSASRLVEMRLGKAAMEPQLWHFTDNFKQYEELAGSHQSVFKFQFLCLYEQPNTDTRQGGLEQRHGDRFTRSYLCWFRTNPSRHRPVGRCQQTDCITEPCRRLVMEPV